MPSPVIAAPMDSASAAAIVTHMECVICTSVMIDPRALSCLHLFCLRCISAIAVTENGTVTIKCPLGCTLETECDAGIESLRKVPVLTAMCAETRRSLFATATSAAQSLACDWCPSFSTNMVLCPRCSSYLCEVCRTAEDQWELNTSPHTAICVRNDPSRFARELEKWYGKWGTGKEGPDDGSGGPQSAVVSHGQSVLNLSWYFYRHRVGAESSGWHLPRDASDIEELLARLTSYPPVKLPLVLSHETGQRTALKEIQRRLRFPIHGTNVTLHSGAPFWARCVLLSLSISGEAGESPVVTDALFVPPGTEMLPFSTSAEPFPKIETLLEQEVVGQVIHVMETVIQLYSKVEGVLKTAHHSLRDVESVVELMLRNHIKHYVANLLSIVSVLLTPLLVRVHISAAMIGTGPLMQLYRLWHVVPHHSKPDVFSEWMRTMKELLSQAQRYDDVAEEMKNAEERVTVALSDFADATEVLVERQKPQFSAATARKDRHPQIWESRCGARDVVGGSDPRGVPQNEGDTPNGTEDVAELVGEREDPRGPGLPHGERAVPIPASLVPKAMLKKFLQLIASLSATVDHAIALLLRIMATAPRHVNAGLRSCFAPPEKLREAEEFESENYKLSLQLLQAMLHITDSCAVWLSVVAFVCRSRVPASLMRKVMKFYQVITVDTNLELFAPSSFVTVGLMRLKVVMTARWGDGLQSADYAMNEPKILPQLFEDLEASRRVHLSNMNIAFSSVTAICSWHAKLWESLWTRFDRLSAEPHLPVAPRSLDPLLLAVAFDDEDWLHIRSQIMRIVKSLRVTLQTNGMTEPNPLVAVAEDGVQSRATPPTDAPQADSLEALLAMIGAHAFVETETLSNHWNAAQIATQSGQQRAAELPSTLPDLPTGAETATAEMTPLSTREACQTTLSLATTQNDVVLERAPLDVGALRTFIARTAATTAAAHSIGSFSITIRQCMVVAVPFYRGHYGMPCSLRPMKYYVNGATGTTAVADEPWPLQSLLGYLQHVLFSPSVFFATNLILLLASTNKHLFFVMPPRT